MARRAERLPTDSELAILQVLWEHGPSTVREIHQLLSRRPTATQRSSPTVREGAPVRRRPTGYTTALKLLQIMFEKGLVARDDSQRSHVYRARLAEAPTQRRIVRDLLERAFGGSAQKLVLQALSAKRASPRELAEIRRLLDRFEKE